MQKNMTWDNVGLTYVSFTSRLIKRGGKKMAWPLNNYLNYPHKTATWMQKVGPSHTSKQLK